jgi:signal peptidase I
MLRKLGDFFIELLQIVVFAVSIFLFIYLLVLQPHKIKGSSMEPNFHDGQYLLTDKLSYRFGIPKRGDVIVFKAPPNFKEEFIKRIIAIPGDTVMVKNGKYFVNGVEIKEKYLPSEFKTAPGNFAIEGKQITVPSDSYFVSGDNRDHSLDSRNFGIINKDKITGRAWLIYWPPKDAGTIKSPEY